MLVPASVPLIVHGYFNSAGDPCIKINLAGAFNDLPGVEFEAIIDTGFSGFLSLPIVRAFPLGLPLTGTSSSVLADGSSSTSLTALVRITVSGMTKQGVVVLQANAADVLLGMDFLRTFKLGLLATRSLILLFEEQVATNVATGAEKPDAAGVVGAAASKSEGASGKAK